MRRIFICLLCISLIAGNMTIASGAQQYNTEEGVHISSGLLEYLGVLDGNEDYTKSVTRKEFAEALAKLLDIENGSYTQNFYYRDIEAGSVINDLTAKGYFEGNGDLFFPDDTITLYDSCLVMLRVLGYQPYLNAINSDYGRIMLTAKKIGVIDKVQENCNITFGTMVGLFNNMLLAKRFKAVEFSGEDIVFSEGECLLSELYDIQYGEGTVIANSITSLYEDLGSTSEGVINISGVLYKFEPFALENVLGKTIEFYYKALDAEMPEIVCFADVSEDEISLINEDVMAYSDDTLRYYENDKTKSCILDNPVVVYNGVATFEMSNSDIHSAIKANRTKIRVNKDINGKYSYLFVDTYVNGKIRYVDYETKTLYVDLPSGSKSFNLESCINEKRCSMMRLSDTKTVEFTQLKNGDFVSVCFDEEDASIRIVVCDKSVSGTVEKVLSGDEAVIGGIKCSLDKDYMSGKGIAPGETGTYYYDAFGNIAFKSVERRYDAKIGYIYGIELKTLIGDEVRLKLYEENGVSNVYTLSKIPVLDGVRADKKTVYEKLISYDVIGKHLVGFKVDNAGQINWIDTANDTGDGENTLRIVRSLDVLNFEIVGSIGNYQFYKDRDAANLSQIDVCFPVSTGANAIVVPDNDAHNKEYVFETKTAISRFVTDGKYNVELYNFGSDSPFVEVVLHKTYDGEQYLDYGQECYMVSRVATSMSDIDEIPTTELDLLHCPDYAEPAINSKKTVQFAPTVTFQQGNQVNQVVDGTKVAELLGEGDVVMIGERADGAGCVVNLLFDYSEQMPFWGDSYESATYADFSAKTIKNRYVFGNVESLYIPSFDTADHYVFSVTDDESFESVRDVCAVQGNYFRYPIYDSSLRKDNAYVGFMNEIDAYQNSNKTTYSKVFVKMIDGVSVDSVFFYK